MAVAYTTHNRILTVTLSGEIDHHRVKGVLQDLDQAIDEVLPRQLIVDCAGITFMDSSGIGVLLNRYKQMKAGHTSFYGACPQVMRVLKVAGILGLMHQYESKEEAIYSREV